MKGYVIFCSAFFLFALSSCRVYPPVYKRVDNFWIEKLDRDGFKVNGSMVFYNPNKIPVKLKDMLMNVELNGKHVATAGQKQPVAIRAQSEFSVPLDLIIKPDMSLTEGIQNIFNIIMTREVEVTIRGVIVVSSYGIKVSIPIEQKEKVDITKLR
jgi:LEA14-like dessication related protein